MNTIFEVSSVTNAMRGKALLERNGIRAEVSRMIDKDGSNGCGYRLIVRGNAERAESLLRGAGIRLLNIHKGEHTP